MAMNDPRQAGQHGLPGKPAPHPPQPGQPQRSIATSLNYPDAGTQPAPRSARLGVGPYAAPSTDSDELALEALEAIDDADGAQPQAAASAHTPPQQMPQRPRPLTGGQPQQHAPHAPSHAPAHPAGHHPPPLRQPAAPSRMPQQTEPPHGEAPDEEDAIALVDDSAAEQSAPKRLRSFGWEGLQKEHQWKRFPVKTGQGPARVKSFHCKLSDQGLEYMDNAICEWLDANPEIDVKFVNSTIGLFDGKFKDLAMILNVWY
jgi:hypothetical protein